MLDPRHGEDDAAFGQLSRSSSRASTAVRSTSTLASALRINHSTSLSAASTDASARRRKSSALAKNSGES